MLSVYCLSLVALMPQVDLGPNHALADAVTRGDLAAASDALLASADPDCVVDAKSGRRALHVAARRGDSEIVHLLLEKGADMEASDRLGMTPLHHSAVMDHAEVGVELLRRGSLLDAVDVIGRSPLMRAVEAEANDWIKALTDPLSKGVRVQLWSQGAIGGVTPLHVGVALGLDLGIDPLELPEPPTTSSGLSPLDFGLLACTANSVLSSQWQAAFGVSELQDALQVPIKPAGSGGQGDPLVQLWSLQTYTNPPEKLRLLVALWDDGSVLYSDGDNVVSGAIGEALAGFVQNALGDLGLAQLPAVHSGGVHSKRHCLGVKFGGAWRKWSFDPSDGDIVTPETGASVEIARRILLCIPDLAVPDDPAGLVNFRGFNPERPELTKWFRKFARQ